MSSVEMCRISLWSCQLPLGALTELGLSTYFLAAELTEAEFFEFFTAMASTLTDLWIVRIFLLSKSEYNLFGVNLPVLVSLEIQYPDYLGGAKDNRNYIPNLWSYINVLALESLTLYWMNNKQFCAIMASLQ